MFNSSKFLKFLAEDHSKRILYYPSAGQRDGCSVCDLHADIFIFSDYRPKSLAARCAFWKRFHQSCARHDIRLITATPIARVFQIDRRKWGLFLFIDNNIALKMIRNSGLKISTWIGVLDGCCEGGNYTCCSEMTFFGKIIDLMPNTEKGLTVITDHSSRLFSGDGWGKPRSYNSFVLKDTTYETSLIKERVPGFRKRACEFIVRKNLQLNEKRKDIA